MDDERWRRVEELYHAAQSRPAHSRAAFLADACRDDETVLAAVASLLEQPAAAATTRSAADWERLFGTFEAAPAGATANPPLVGRRIGPYQLQGLVGAGGMGEVYRARDTKLARDVAIKLLPAAFTADPDRLARFEREARVLASLNHPHIATIHGLEEDEGVHAIVMELVEGETLADRVARAPLPIDEALELAQQVAAALNAAHEKGIVHRDLKPANIAIGRGNAAKVVDFGLAKLEPLALSASGAAPGSHAPTVTVGGTREGLVVGTAAYMSPEQARGQAVDRRTDIWAFGCVLYEMLTGRPAFARATMSDTIAAVLDREPDWSALPAATPTDVLRLLRRCLRKAADERLRDLGDVGLFLEDIEQVAPASVLLPRHQKRVRVRVGLLSGIGSVIVVSVATWFWWNRAPGREQASVVRLSISAPGAVSPQLSAAISPDGRQVAFVATDSSGHSRLWVRALDSLQARELPGTERAAHPFWSPDGESLGFIADGRLKRVELAGGPVRVLADAQCGTGPPGVLTARAFCS